MLFPDSAEAVPSLTVAEVAELRIDGPVVRDAAALLGLA
jgi:hypothetical protein